MKKIFFYIFVSLFLTSCNRNLVEPAQDESNYFLKNKSKFLTMDRMELALQSKNIQIWTINNYTNQQKVNLFKEKLQKILDTKSFGEEKNKVIIFALENLNKDFFSNASIKNRLINQIQIMTKVSGFSDEEVAAVFFSINDIEYDKSGKIKLIGNSEKYLRLAPDIGTKLSCNMEWCLTCGLTGGNFNCESDCESTTRGCGWFLSEGCTKICR